jgi:hypothetical protein
MFPDFKELLSGFNAHSVKYLIVGGYAVSFHAQPRATTDIDLMVKPEAGNAKAVHAALAQCGAPLEGLTPVDFAERGSFFPQGPRTCCHGYPLRGPRVSILTLHGNAESTISSSPQPDSRRASFPAAIPSARSLRRAPPQRRN